MSLHAKKDAETNQKIIDMKEEYERQILALTSAKQEAEQELKETKVHLQSAESKGKEAAIKVVQQTKEIDVLKKDIAKLQKGFESQLSQVQASNKAMYEEKARFQVEI